MDFDGVVNAITKSPYKAIYGDWVRTTMQGYPIWYSPTVIDFIARAAGAGVRVVWLTTWGQWTEDFPAQLPGMPELPYLPTPDGPQETWPSGVGGQPWWKLQQVQATVGQAPFVWTDDDLQHRREPGRQAHEWARWTPGRLVMPRPNLGLIPRDLRSLSEHFAEHDLDVPAPAVQTS